MAAVPHCGFGSLPQAAIPTITRKLRATQTMKAGGSSLAELAAGRDPNLALAASIGG
jgi:hypothetical protein